MKDGSVDGKASTRFASCKARTAAESVLIFRNVQISNTTDAAVVVMVIKMRIAFKSGYWELIAISPSKKGSASDWNIFASRLAASAIFDKLKWDCLTSAINLFISWL